MSPFRIIMTTIIYIEYPVKRKKGPVPVIATDAGGVLDLLGSPDSSPSQAGFIVCERGILCRKDDSSGFAQGFQYLVGIDEISKHRLLTRARSFVQENFSEERLIRDMESLYLNLTAHRG
jgi:glycosyltransferase involved in cell wall biosynthesis